jgi:excisionase family DNA binding protein
MPPTQPQRTALSYTPVEAARLIGVERAMIARMLEAGTLRPVFNGNALAVAKADVDRLVAQKRAYAEEARLRPARQAERQAAKQARREAKARRNKATLKLLTRVTAGRTLSRPVIGKAATAAAGRLTITQAAEVLGLSEQRVQALVKLYPFAAHGTGADLTLDALWVAQYKRDLLTTSA